MDIIVTIIIFVLIFSLLVLVHEFGHFWAAKRAGIKVEEFGFGLPPRIWGKKKGETIYSVNWIPFGGFVRMLGEDAHDPKMIKDPRSFIAKSKWKRTQVVVAGVLMNFLLSFVLLTFGFSVGMEPLLVNSNDLVRAIENGAIELQSGVVIKEISVENNAEEFGFREGDRIVGFESKNAQDDEYLQDVLAGSVGTYQVLQGKSLKSIEVSEPLEGVEFYTAQEFPAVKVLASSHQWLTDDSYVLDRDGKRLLSVEALHDLLAAANPADEFGLTVFQEGKERKIPLKNIQAVEYNGVYVQKVAANSPAEEAGIKAGDKILQVNDKAISELRNFMDFSKESSGEEAVYLVESRERGLLNFNISPDKDGRIGVFISQLLLIDAGLDGQIVFSSDSLPTSLISVKDVKYPVYQAPFEALREMGRLSILTAYMFADVIGDLISGEGVPDTVAGPVGIASLTHGVVQDGIFATLRFIALLSLSLGVINILPLPALDGGRLLFIVVEAVTGRRVNQKWEAYIHSIGFLLLMLLILIITYNDILRFF